MKFAARTRAGFTIVESTISLALLAILTSVFVSSLQGANQVRDETAARYELHRRGLEAIARIRGDLRCSGFVTRGVDDYPQLIDDDELDLLPAGLGHDAPHDSGEDVTSREIVFVQPGDGDNDGWADYDVSGNVVWDAADFAYVLVPEADGTNSLYRRSSTGDDELIVTGVLRVLFDDSISAAAAIPAGCIRITLQLRRTDGGPAVTFTREALVRLTNGGV